MEENVEDAEYDTPIKGVRAVEVSRADLKTLRFNLRERTEKYFGACRGGEEKKGAISLALGYKEGMLKKKSSKVFSTWTPQYCIVRDSFFVCYSNFATGKISLVLSFARSHVCLKTDAKCLSFSYNLQAI